MAIYSISSIQNTNNRRFWTSKTNALLNLIDNQPDIDKIYLYAKDPYTHMYWGVLAQFSTKPLFYNNISPLIFLCGIFIASNQRFMVVYHGLSLIAVQCGLRIQG